MIVCMNHPLTAQQVEDARESLRVDSFVQMPEPVRIAWKQVDPETPIPRDVMRETIGFLTRESTTHDLVLVQGEFGVVFATVTWCFHNGRIPVYSTTRRVYSHEDAGGAKVNRHVFKHVRFRKYFVMEEIV